MPPPPAAAVTLTVAEANPLEVKVTTAEQLGPLDNTVMSPVTVIIAGVVRVPPGPIVIKDAVATSAGAEVKT